MLYDFGPRLLRLRRRRGLTQQALADRVKMLDPNLRLTDSVLGKYEKDQSVPRLSEAAAISDVLDVSLDYLAEGEKIQTLSLKELNKKQIQLLVELVSYFRRKNRSTLTSNLDSIPPEDAALIARVLAEFYR